MTISLKLTISYSEKVNDFYVKIKNSRLFFYRVCEIIFKVHKNNQN